MVERGVRRTITEEETEPIRKGLLFLLRWHLGWQVAVLGLFAGVGLAGILWLAGWPEAAVDVETAADESALERAMGALASPKERGLVVTRVNAGERPDAEGRISGPTGEVKLLLDVEGIVRLRSRILGEGRRIVMHLPSGAQELTVEASDRKRRLLPVRVTEGTSTAVRVRVEELGFE
jgi:hypothetical protein